MRSAAFLFSGEPVFERIITCIIYTNRQDYHLCYCLSALFHLPSCINCYLLNCYCLFHGYCLSGLFSWSLAVSYVANKMIHGLNCCVGSKLKCNIRCARQSGLNVPS
jgi:hypothetical protein